MSKKIRVIKRTDEAETGEMSQTINSKDKVMHIVCIFKEQQVDDRARTTTDDERGC